jgi:hypothetical protein
MHPYGMQREETKCFSTKIPQYYLSRQFELKIGVAKCTPEGNNILYVEKFYIFLRLICPQRLFSAVDAARSRRRQAQPLMPAAAVDASRSRHSERSRGISTHSTKR